MISLEHRKNAALGRLASAFFSLLLFALGYGIANRFQLTHNVLYRLAVDDYQSAAAAFLSLSVQGAVLLTGIVLISRRGAWLLMAVMGLSIAVNLGYGQLVQAPLEIGSFAWLLVELRQAWQVAGEFGSGLLFSGTQTIVAIMLFAGSWLFADKALRIRHRPALTVAAIVLVVSPSLMTRYLPLWPESAERNIYSFGFDIIRAPAPPPRGDPSLKLSSRKDGPRHIVWIIDESVAYEPFRRLVHPNLDGVSHKDFGVAASMGNCSAPAHVALRSGVDVRRADERTDLRRTPSIWAFARKAGYRTRIIDGQTIGTPQNYLFEPERALIDEYRQMAGDLNTDTRIAKALNADMRKLGRSFTYVILRGVHFQYRDHFPRNTLPETAPIADQYDAALRWSKRRFFDLLLNGIDRSTVAVVYTSDHGQNLAEGVLPHCSRQPVTDEFRVPLLAFLPEAIAARYGEGTSGGRSASQIFPATLLWMGFDQGAVEAQYDYDLTRPTARYVWFGRKVVPMNEEDKIEIHTGRVFPGSGLKN